MEITVRDDKKLVEIWLTKAERDDITLQIRLKPLYAAYKARKYLVVVLQSGERSLPDCSSGLLRHNQTVAAQRDLERMKEAVS